MTFLEECAYMGIDKATLDLLPIAYYAQPAGENDPVWTLGLDMDNPQILAGFNARAALKDWEPR